jgi:hypothetical protein
VVAKPLKKLRMAIFDARAETVETKPVFRDAHPALVGFGDRLAAAIPSTSTTEPSSGAGVAPDARGFASSFP